MEDSSQRSFKEKRLREILFIYYSRPDVRKAMFEFAQNRETIPRYYEGFGKRPDTFQYDSDILEQVRKGATSFHCSEEIWEDPLEISNEFSEQEFNDLRIGWDLLLDIDSPYLEYSKIYADLLIKTLEFHGIENIGVKFSGSKGFHIIIPWKAFPKEIYGQQSKNMFPEWPRAICEYLTEIIQPKLEKKIFQGNLKDLAKKTGKKEEDLLITECLSCHRSAEKKELVTWICENCKNELVMIRKTKRIPKCPNEDCRKDLIEVSKKQIYACEFCQTNSQKNEELFAKTRQKTEILIEADLILVAPRHLFRMPYSLHEKTALSSIVIDKNKIKDFQILDANAFKIEIKNFYPDSKPEEAKNLLLQALDWKEQKQQEKNKIQEKFITEKTKFPQKKQGEFKQVSIPNPTPDLYPPCINLLLKGVKQDGRKRGLFILINFFKTIGVDEAKLIEIINNWNEKNHKPLKQGYIQSQLNWYRKTGARLPPNCDKPNYNDLAICKPDELCRQIKNPINYAFKKYFRNKR
jgi:hypothetical protein